MIGGRGLSFLTCRPITKRTLHDLLRWQQQLQTQKCPDSLFHLDIQLEQCFLNFLNHKCNLDSFVKYSFLCPSSEGSKTEGLGGVPGDSLNIRTTGNTLLHGPLFETFPRFVVPAPSVLMFPKDGLKRHRIKWIFSKTKTLEQPHSFQDLKSGTSFNYIQFMYQQQESNGIATLTFTAIWFSVWRLISFLQQTFFFFPEATIASTFFFFFIF